MFKKVCCIVLTLFFIAAAGAVPALILAKTAEVPVALPRYREYRPSVSASGTMEAAETYQIVSAGIYRVQEVYVALGDRVAQGDPIAVLGAPEGSAYCIAGSGGSLTEQLQAAAYAYGVDLSQLLERYGASGFEIAADATRTVVSPIDGVITSAVAAKDSVVTAGGAICAIASDGVFTAVVEVGENRIGGIEVGDEALLSCSGIEQKVYGYVGCIYPTAEKSIAGLTANTTVRVGIVPYDLPNSVRSGGTVSAIIYTDSARSVLTVPYEAVDQDLQSNAEYVWVAANGVLERREITTGVEFADCVEVASGLSDGEPVVEQQSALAAAPRRYFLRVN